MKIQYIKKIVAVLGALLLLLGTCCASALAVSAAPAAISGPGRADVPEFVDPVMNGTIVMKAPDGAEYVRIPKEASGVIPTAFKGNTTVKVIDFAGDETTVSDGAFAGCTSLTQVNLPKGMTDIPKELFKGCTSLQSAVIPEGVAVIGDGAFDGCTSMTGVVLPASLNAIGAEAFAGTKSLKAIEIPKDVAAVGKNAFAGSGLTQLTFHGTKADLSWDDTGIDESKVTLSFPDDPDFWNPAEDQAWLQTAYRYESGTWVVLVRAVPRETCRLTAGGPMLGKTPGYTVRGPQTQDVPAGGSPGDTFEFVLSGKMGDKITVHLTGSTGASRTAFEKDLDFVIPWDPADTASWITISDQNPRSGDTVVITATCPQASVSFVLVAEPLAGSAAFIQTEPSYGSVIALSSASAAQKSAVIRATVTGNKGDRIRLRIGGKFSAGGYDEGFTGELPDLVISQSAPSTPGPQPSASTAPSPSPAPSPEPTPIPSPSPSPQPSSSPTLSPGPSDAPLSVIALDPASGMEIGEDIFGKGVLFVDDGTRALQIEKAFGESLHAYMEFENAKGEPVALGERVATGYKAIFRNTVTTQPVRELTIVVWGDAQGTGKITLTQLVITAGSYVGVRPLSGCYLMAVDFNRNFHVNLSDLVHEAQLFLTRSDYALSSGTA